MKSKILNFILILTSLVGYLEWGGGNSVFLAQAEAMILAKLFSDTLSVIHPFTILPLTGQLLLLITLFQKQPSKKLTWIGIGGIGVLFVLMLVIGLIGFKMKIVLSALPFLVCSVVTIIHHRKK